MTFKRNIFQELANRDFKEQSLKIFGNEINIIRVSDNKEIKLNCVITELTRKQVNKNYDIFVNDFDNFTASYLDLAFDPTEWQEKFLEMPVIKEQFIINNRLFSVLDIINNNYAFFNVLFVSIEQ